MVVGFTTTCEISAFHLKSCCLNLTVGERYSIQHYVIKVFSDLRQIDPSPVSSPNNTDHHDITEILLKWR